LPALILTESHPSEGNLAIGPMSAIPSQPILITTDQALAIAWDEDAQPSASSRQVVLGMSDPSVSWALEHPVVYIVRWFDVCVPLWGLPSDHPTDLPTCVVSEWDTVLDAYSGEFVVGGS
jgi:hypothetical protein